MVHIQRIKVLNVILFLVVAMLPDETVDRVNGISPLESVHQGEYRRFTLREDYIINILRIYELTRYSSCMMTAKDELQMGITGAQNLHDIDRHPVGDRLVEGDANDLGFSIEPIQHFVGGDTSHDEFLMIFAAPERFLAVAVYEIDIVAPLYETSRDVRDIHRNAWNAAEKITYHSYERWSYHGDLHQSAPDLQGDICKEGNRNTEVMLMVRMSDVSMNPSFNNRVDCTGSVRTISYRLGYGEST